METKLWNIVVKPLTINVSSQEGVPNKSISPDQEGLFADPMMRLTVENGDLLDLAESGQFPRARAVEPFIQHFHQSMARKSDRPVTQLKDDQNFRAHF
jgi:hypothetical protein